MASDVQAWHDGVLPTHGWLIVGDDSAAGTARRFDSRETAVTANRPTLTVTYSVPTGVENEVIPAGITLDSCHPNPGSGSARLVFTLAASAHVSLVVHDVRGRRLSMVADRTFTTGRHELAWAGSRIDGNDPSGIYFLTLSVNGRAVGTRRWVRIR